MKRNLNVLVVDDEEDQLQTLCRGLLYLGHGCIPARSAREALALLAARGEAIDVLLVDLSAPGKPGAFVIEPALRSRPALVVLVVTGLALSTRARGLPVLRKPFTPEQLGHAIRTAMTRDDSPKGEGT
jgi:CheY-like chemotaxis protein